MKPALPRKQLQRRVKRRDVSATRRGRSGDPLGFWLFITLIIFTLLSVPERIKAIAVIRPTLLLIAVITVLIVINDSYRKQKQNSNTAKYLTILAAYTVLTVPFVEWPGSVLNRGLENFLKAIIFFYFAAYLVDNLRRLQILIFVILSCQVIRVLEPLYLHVTTGYWGSKAHMGDGEFLPRLAGAPSDIINPNGLAFVILTALPFLHYLLGGSPRKPMQLAYVALLPMLLYAFTLTGSRSGLVGLVVLAAVIAWRSRYRLALAAAMVVAALAMVAVTGTDMRERYLSVAEHGTRHEETRSGRLEGTLKELKVALRRPLFGHGLGTSAEAMAHFGGRQQIAHNLFSEALLEIGAVGLFLYLRVLASIMQNVYAVGPTARHLAERVAACSSDDALLERLNFFQRVADAIFAWVVMCLIFSLASYGLSEFYWYMIAGVSVALVSVMSEEHRAITVDTASPAVSSSKPSRSVRVSRNAKPN
jgi:O-antigen ligase